MYVSTDILKCSFLKLFIYTKSMQDLFLQERFGINCSGCILEDLRTAAQNPSMPVAMASAVEASPILSLIQRCSGGRDLRDQDRD